MTKVLVLGGTGWLSSRIASAWAHAGAEVTCLARGARPAPTGTTLVRGDRDGTGVYTQLAYTDWDEIVDITSLARHARDAVAALGDRTARWTYISSISVYADDTAPGLDERAPLHAPATGDDDEYPAQKAGAEQAVSALGVRARVVRPGLIVGPGDPSDRFGYWAAAFARAGDGPVLMPPTRGRRCQVIDVDDLAAFVVSDNWRGAIDAIGASQPLGDVLHELRSAADHTGELVHASEEALVTAGVQYWMGEHSLPLWVPAEMTGFMRRTGDLFHRTADTRTPLQHVIERVLADERERGLDRRRRSGLSRAQELAVLEQVRDLHLGAR